MTPPTAEQVNEAIADGVDYIDCQQDQAAGSGFGSFNGDVPETAAAVIAYGVLATPANKPTDIANLPTAVDDPACVGTPRNFQTDMTNAVAWLLGQQDTTDPIATGQDGGSWSFSGGNTTYSTGLALAALAYSATVPVPAGHVATAIANGRAFLENEFQSSPFETCSTDPSDSSSSYCGGWNYEPETGRSDESNTGFAMTGLALTGGVPAAIQTVDVGWQNNVQSDSTSNPTYAGSRNDGGAGYQPSYAGQIGAFSSNALDTGTNLFGYGDDGIPNSDARVQASLLLSTDVLDTYEEAAHSATSVEHVAVYHTADSEDGSCDPSAAGCSWAFDGDGGYHYSLFALSKGIGSYIQPNLSDGSNWYAKIADLLVASQDTTNGSSFGHWTDDGRDDYSDLFATGLSVFALGLVAVQIKPPPPRAFPNLNDVVQVETSPVFAGKTVVISAHRLRHACDSLRFETLQGGSVKAPRVSGKPISVVLDGDGNVDVVADGVNCTPGRYPINVAMNGTAIAGSTTLVVSPPQTSFPYGVTGYPGNEVETGTTAASGHSLVYTVFSVQTSPHHAEQSLRITSRGLFKWCGEGSRWESNDGAFVNRPSATATIDDDGHAVFVFKGVSCAAGSYAVSVTSAASSHINYTTTYSVAPPSVTYTGGKRHMFVIASPDPVTLIGD